MQGAEAVTDAVADGGAGQHRDGMRAGFTVIVVSTDSGPLAVTTCVLWPAPTDPEAGETGSLPTRLEGIQMLYCVTRTFPAVSVSVPRCGTAQRRREHQHAGVISGPR